METNTAFTNIQLTDKEFATIANFIEKNVGIKMPENKRLMMQSRLMVRLRKLGMHAFSEYIEYVFHKDTKGEELILMIDALTTNKTDFFREADHFVYMTNSVLPEFAQKNKNTVKLWSAACSSGEEPYTLSIVMKEFMRKNPNKISAFTITASDISTKVLDKAIKAVYDLSALNEIAVDIKKMYFLKSTDKINPKVCVKPEVRKQIKFMRLNFMDDDFRMPETYQIIFCRNVLIYFDKETQEAVIRKLLRYLEPNGYLFLGHSETILNMDLPLKTVAPTVYQFIG